LFTALANSSQRATATLIIQIVGQPIVAVGLQPAPHYVRKRFLGIRFSRHFALRNYPYDYCIFSGLPV
jgi:hypothetical protein